MWCIDMKKDKISLGKGKVTQICEHKTYTMYYQSNIEGEHKNITIPKDTRWCPNCKRVYKTQITAVT